MSWSVSTNEGVRPWLDSPLAKYASFQSVADFASHNERGAGRGSSSSEYELIGFTFNIMADWASCRNR